MKASSVPPAYVLNIVRFAGIDQKKESTWWGKEGNRIELTRRENTQGRVESAGGMTRFMGGP